MFIQAKYAQVMSYTCRIYVFLSLQDHLGVITAAWTMCPSRQEQKPRQTSNVHNIQPLLAAGESTHHNRTVWPKLYINYVIILQTEAIGNACWNNNAEYNRVSPQLYITDNRCISIVSRNTYITPLELDSICSSLVFGMVHNSRESATIWTL